MVEDFVVAADLFVLVAEGVEAVGAAGDDCFGLDGWKGGTGGVYGDPMGD